MVETIITKANGKDSVIDFRDALCVSDIDHYARIHAKGGKDSGFPSCIKMYLCDYRKGTGDKSTTVSANLSPDIIFELYEACKRNVGSGMAISTASPGVTHLGSIASALTALLKHKSRRLGADYKGEQITKEQLLEDGKNIKAALTGLSEQGAITLTGGVDYGLVIRKANPYKRGNDGYAPFTTVQINRTSLKGTADLSRYPWYIKVVNGEAPLNEKEGGAVNYDESKSRNVKEAAILISDRDMFRMMHQITEYIKIFENAYGIPVVLAGRKKIDEERKG